MSFGSLHTPSINKMHGQELPRPSLSKSAARFDMGNIIGDPFALATISISILAWLIAFISSAISDATEAFPNFAWWSIVYMLFCIIGVTVVVASDAIYTYNVAIVGFLSAGLVFSTSSANSLVYSKSGAEEAAAAGHILLSMVSILWIFYFGSTPKAVTHAYIDSFALHKDSKVSHNPRAYASGYGSQIHQVNSMSSHPAPQMYTSAQLSGLEATSPAPMGMGGGSMVDRSSGINKFGASSIVATPNQATAPQPQPGQTDDEVAPPTEYPYRAKAIYSYTANPEDSNEISFSKHDILEVSDVSGRWWQARKESGETGIAPSNYLILL